MIRVHEFSRVSAPAYLPHWALEQNVSAGVGCRHDIFSCVGTGNAGRRTAHSYPGVTSRIIITRKHTGNPMVADPSFPLSWDSGMTSSTTTKTIAPDANTSA